MGTVSGLGYIHEYANIYLQARIGVHKHDASTYLPGSQVPPGVMLIILYICA